MGVADLPEGEGSDNTPRGVSPLVMRLLQSYSWPGNVRELFSVLESAFIRVEPGRPVEAQHLPLEIRERARSTEEGSIGEVTERYAQPESVTESAARRSARPLRDIARKKSTRSEPRA